MKYIKCGIHTLVEKEKGVISYFHEMANKGKKRKAFLTGFAVVVYKLFSSLCPAKKGRRKSWGEIFTTTYCCWLLLLLSLGCLPKSSLLPLPDINRTKVNIAWPGSRALLTTKLFAISSLKIRFHNFKAYHKCVFEIRYHSLTAQKSGFENLEPENRLSLSFM